MNHRQKKRPQQGERKQRGWSRTEIMMLIALLIEIIKLILDRLF